VLAHLAQVTTNPSRQHPIKSNIFHIPELLYIATLLSGLGPLSTRVSTFGLAQSLVHTLAHQLYIEDGSSEPTRPYNHEALMAPYGITGTIELADEYSL
jgi:hypothetical protein